MGLPELILWNQLKDLKQAVRRKPSNISELKLFFKLKIPPS